MVCLTPQRRECPQAKGIAGQVTCDGLVIFTIYGDGHTEGDLQNGIMILEELIEDGTYGKRDTAGMMLGMLKAIKKAREK